MKDHKDRIISQESAMVTFPDHIEAYCGDEESVSSSDFEGSSFESHLDRKKHATTNDESQPTIARAETRAVLRSKLIVFVVLVLSTIGVALAVYYYTSNTEQNQFELQFSEDARKVLEAIGKSLDDMFGLLDSYTVGLLSAARSTGQEWPFVVIPDFGLRTTKVLSLSDILILSIYPLVTPENRLEWEAFSMANGGWVNESMKLQANDKNYYGPIIWEDVNYGVVHNDFYDIPYDSERIMLPLWQNAPVVPRWPPFNWDLKSVVLPKSVDACLETRQAILSEAYNLANMSNEEEVKETEAFIDWFSDFVPPGDDPGEPPSDIYYPIIDNKMDSVEIQDGGYGSTTEKMVGMVDAIFYWRDVIRGILPMGSYLQVVFENPCNPTFTYQLEGPSVTYLGRGDMHARRFDHMVLESSLRNRNLFSIRNSRYTGIPLNDTLCPFTFKVYPSVTMEADYKTTNPAVFTAVAVLIFAFTSVVFIAYDYLVERRQRKVISTAVRSTAIISSLFPSVVRDRILPAEDEVHSHSHQQDMSKTTNPRNRLKSFLNNGTTLGGSDEDSDTEPLFKSRPIAELFPECTVLFADIEGFTAWSSTRDAAQVFTLLETLYSAFDAIAKKRGVYKVETIGDSYLAVCGLPEPRMNHAVVMARFAGDCRTAMHALTRRLSKSLGPDTADLSLRFGLNSGPVTAGVLRGERSRFQLFGDTVNTATLMDSLGEPSRIHASQKTADKLIAAGKRAWLTAREDLVEAKGKGLLQTYWVEPMMKALSTVDTGSESIFSDRDEDHLAFGLDAALGCISPLKVQMLIDWNLDAFESILKCVVAHRQATGRISMSLPDLNMRIGTKFPREEVAEAINLPKFNSKMVQRSDPRATELDAGVIAELRDFIQVCAFSYRPNAFHNFEHAGHVVMATRKLLSHAVNQDVSLVERKSDRKIAKTVAKQLNSSTLGVISDPMAQFALLFAALIHDIDHPGVPNNQLVQEDAYVARLYNNQSVTEQNSISVAWDLFMVPKYSQLHACLFADESDIRRFRQLVVNAVMATDIFDNDLKAMREARWQKAFREGDDADETDCKATIAVDYVIQVSDVSHAMQHWNVYQKWNRCLFREMYTAYKAGRASNDPSPTWYESELRFFDGYIIPLAKKLKECGVFGASCDEFLNYAVDNRTVWANRGRAIVNEMVEEATRDYQEARSRNSRHRWWRARGATN